MDKIRALMQKAGLKPELADKICEGVVAHCDAYKRRKDTEYKSKLEEAKRVCVEETETHKRELARQLQVFCEAKCLAIEATIAKSSAQQDSEALTRLRGIQGLLEGVTPIGEPNGSLKTELERLKRKLRQVTEARAQAVEHANRQTAIAGSALKRNRLLESQLRKNRSTVAESSQEREEAPRPQRSQGAQPLTTRPTLLENQTRRAAQPRPKAPEPNSPEAIAAMMSSDLV